jgi:plasmid stability protein
MGQVIVRNLDDRVIAALKARAKLRGHSLERELRTILTRSAGMTAAEKLAVADRVRAMTPRRLATDSTELVREDRDRR